VESVYDITAVPKASPFTMPVEGFTVATDGLLLVHVPPAGVLLSVAVIPIQTFEPPVIDAGKALTVRSTVCAQPVPTVYVIVVVPTAAPPATPVKRATVPITGLLLVQSPPGALLVSVVVWPMQIFAAPPIGGGIVFTVTIAVARQPVGNV
jgi:hypothetical protein